MDITPLPILILLAALAWSALAAITLRDLRKRK